MWDEPPVLELQEQLLAYLESPLYQRLPRVVAYGPLELRPADVRSAVRLGWVVEVDSLLQDVGFPFAEKADVHE